MCEDAVEGGGKDRQRCYSMPRPRSPAALPPCSTAHQVHCKYLHHLLLHYLVETCVRDCCRFITLSCPRPAPGKPPPGLTSASSSPAGVGRRAVQRTVRPAHMPCGLEPDSDEATLCGEASNPPQHQQTRYQGRMKMNINRTIYICHLAWH